MISERFLSIAKSYPSIRIAIVGDFCLDRYLEIDPDKQEISIETNLPVHNVVRVRSQPGGAGTILNNLCALGIGQIDAIGFCGDDGEGWELRRALGSRPNVSLDHFITTEARKTFTYTKPLLMHPGKPPVELNRLDIKNWTATPPGLVDRLRDSIHALAGQIDAMILLDQVDLADTGVVTSQLLEAVAELANRFPELPIIADSRRGLAAFPKVTLKMNHAELARTTGAADDLDSIRTEAVQLARGQGKPVFVTLAQRGMIAAVPAGDSWHVPALPIRGEIDVVGAGDAVTANLAAVLAAGGAPLDAVETAMVAASIVIHQLGTTGTASPGQIKALMGHAA